MRRFALPFLVVSALGLLVTSCVRLPEPRPSNTKYYLLESTAPTDTTGAGTTGLRIGLRQPRLAAYLETPTIVTRHGANEIAFSEFHRWGEDLSTVLNRVVALNLEARPGIQSAEGVPWTRGTTFDYVVQLRVLRFEGVGPRPPGPEADDDAPIPEGHSQMTVAWTLLGPEGTDVRARGRTEHRIDGWPVTDYPDLVAKLDRSLVVLARDLHTRLQSLAPSPTP